MCLHKVTSLQPCISSLSISTWISTFRMKNWVHHCTGLHSAQTSLLLAIFWLGVLTSMHKTSKGLHLSTSVCSLLNNHNQRDWYVICSSKAQISNLLTKRIEQLMPTLQIRSVVLHGKKQCARSSETATVITRSLGINYSSSFKSNSHCTNNISRRLPWTSLYW